MVPKYENFFNVHQSYCSLCMTKYKAYLKKVPIVITIQSRQRIYSVGIKAMQGSVWVKFPCVYFTTLKCGYENTYRKLRSWVFNHP
ncbi:hypothetical protein BDR03DRAFT_940241 [Suillus americanus]|nr:hypothetical protein BDR03DRAFT_940241 [Suillus americanus]